jgi:hypothetical protein
MGLLDRLFGGRKPTPSSTSTPPQIAAAKRRDTSETISGTIARDIANTFSAGQFAQHFGDESLAPNWTYNDALAAWYSLGNLALVNTVTHHFGARHDIAGQVLDAVRAQLVTEWNLSDAAFSRLQKIQVETEKQAFIAFNSCKEGNDLSRFFARYVSMILGSTIPFSSSTLLEDQLQGFEYRGTDPFRQVQLSSTFMDTCIRIKDLLKQWPVETPPVQTQSFDTSDYGPAAMPPSREASAIRDLLSTTDKAGLDDALSHMQKWMDEGSGGSGVALHPETRGCIWGVALAEIANRYQDAGTTDKAAFFMQAAWTVSKYPIFANNAALLSFALGDRARGEELTQYFLTNYESALTNDLFKLIINSELSAEELQRLVTNARKRLDALHSSNGTGIQ